MYCKSEVITVKAQQNCQHAILHWNDTFWVRAKLQKKKPERWILRIIVAQLHRHTLDFGCEFTKWDGNYGGSTVENILFFSWMLNVFHIRNTSIQGIYKMITFYSANHSLFDQRICCEKQLWWTIGNAWLILDVSRTDVHVTMSVHSVIWRSKPQQCISLT